MHTSHCSNKKIGEDIVVNTDVSRSGGFLRHMFLNVDN